MHGAVAKACPGERNAVPRQAATEFAEELADLGETAALDQPARGKRLRPAWMGDQIRLLGFARRQADRPRLVRPGQQLVAQDV